jgi:hypothetical protein
VGGCRLDGGGGVNSTTDVGVGAFFLFNHLFTIHAQLTVICQLTAVPPPPPTTTTTHHHHPAPTSSRMCSLRYRSGPCHFVSVEDYYSSEFASSTSPTVAAPVVSRDVRPYLTQYVIPLSQAFVSNHAALEELSRCLRIKGLIFVQIITFL